MHALIPTHPPRVSLYLGEHPPDPLPEGYFPLDSLDKDLFRTSLDRLYPPPNRGRSSRTRLGKACGSSDGRAPPLPGRSCGPLPVQQCPKGCVPDQVPIRSNPQESGRGARCQELQLRAPAEARQVLQPTLPVQVGEIERQEGHHRQMDDVYPVRRVREPADPRAG